MRRLENGEQAVSIPDLPNRARKLIDRANRRRFDRRQDSIRSRSEEEPIRLDASPIGLLQVRGTISPVRATRKPNKEVPGGAITISPHLKSPGGPRDCINSPDRIQNTGRRVYTDAGNEPRVDVDVLSSRLLSRISIRIQRVPDARINGRPGESRLKSCTMITGDARMLKYHRHRTDWKPGDALTPDKPNGDREE